MKDGELEAYNEWINAVAFMMSPYIFIKNRTRESKFRSLFKKGYTPNQAIGFWVLSDGKL